MNVYISKILVTVEPFKAKTNMTITLVMFVQNLNTLSLKALPLDSLAIQISVMKALRAPSDTVHLLIR
jgi:hypothetical protein